MSTLTGHLENHSIYIFMNLRGAEPGFHWGIFVPKNKPRGHVWHAVNRTGAWNVEAVDETEIPNIMSLCLTFKVGSIENWEKLVTTLGNVEGNGQPSPNTGEAITCRVWVKDALLALHNSGIVCLAKPIDTIEREAIKAAEDNRTAVEQGTGSARVWNDTGFFGHMLSEAENGGQGANND